MNHWMEGDVLGLEQYKELFTDAWAFFRRISVLDGSDSSWEKVLRYGSELAQKHGNSRISKDLILAIEDEFERSRGGN